MDQVISDRDWFKDLPWFGDLAACACLKYMDEYGDFVDKAREVLGYVSIEVRLLEHGWHRAKFLVSTHGRLEVEYSYGYKEEL